MAAQAITILGGGNWASLKIEFDRWRTSGESIFPKEVWDAADQHHGYQWWHSFGDDFKFLTDVAVRVLSKPIAASACEFCWSDVSQVITKKTTQRKNGNIEMMVNIRAMHKLEKSLSGKVLAGNIPKLDDFLDSMVNQLIDESGGLSGDDTEVTQEPEDEGSDDDEQYDVVSEDVEELYELGGTNPDLDQVVALHL